MLVLDFCHLSKGLAYVTCYNGLPMAIFSPLILLYLSLRNIVQERLASSASFICV